jgi:hypothetical protein
MSHEPSAIASVLRPPRSGPSEMRALPWVLGCALRSLLYALPSYAQEPGPPTSNAGAPDAAAPSGPPPTPVTGPPPGSETAASGASHESGELEVTTSPKRVEAVQETPAVVSVVGPRQQNGARGAKIHNLDELSGLVPSFSIDAQQTSACLVASSIRGINLQNFDLQSIAVLRCPLEPGQNASGRS